MWARMRNTIRAKIARNSDTYGSFLSRWSFDEAIATIPYYITYTGRSLKVPGARGRCGGSPVPIHQKALLLIHLVPGPLEFGEILDLGGDGLDQSVDPVPHPSLVTR
jgi:hypothetical protein